MRRPRGPGGRFLTAEEIAAQKLTQQSAEEQNTPAVLIDPSDPHLDQELTAQSRILTAPDSNPASIANTSYTSTNSSSPLLSPAIPPTFSEPSTVPISSTQSSPAQTSPVSPANIPQHPGKPPGNASVVLRPSYTPAHMHHVPHPHAHTRLRHSHLNFTDDLYQAEESPQAPSGTDSAMVTFSSQTTT